jgi:hypothetical protein
MGNLKASVMAMIRRLRYSSWYLGIGRETSIASNISARLIEPQTVALC